MSLSKNEAIEILNYDISDIGDLVKKVNNNKTSRDITFSKNVFLPLTHICQNNCGYCTFRETVDSTSVLLMDEKSVYSQVEKAVNLNSKEAMFAFGESAEKNEYIAEELKKHACETMVDYVCKLSDHILDNYDILPHTNMGIVTPDELYRLKQVNASMGLMLETTNKDLLKTIVHNKSPGKNPKIRLNYMEEAGKLNIPFTTGLLVGIGESKVDRVESLLKIRELQDKYGHIQEIIIQNFKPKPGIAMEDQPESPVIELIKLTMLASLMFPDVSIQIPPNLNDKLTSIFIIAGADDFGGISAVSKDFVNPEDKWPEIDTLRREVESIDYNLIERLPVYRKYISKEYLPNKVYEKAVKLDQRI